MEQLLLRVEEVARTLGIGRSKVYELVSRGELPTVRVGKALRVPAEALRRWIGEKSAETASDGRAACACNATRPAGGPRARAMEMVVRHGCGQTQALLSGARQRELRHGNSPIMEGDGQRGH